MKKILDLVVKENSHLNQNYCLLKLTTKDGIPLGDITPGQFVEIQVTNSVHTFLRRPISVNFVDYATNQLWLLVQIIGEGTRWMSQLKPEDLINVILPLGNSFSIPQTPVSQKVILIGGGVGTAPLLYLGAKLQEKGIVPNFLLGARSQKDLLQLDQFSKYGHVYCTTEDGSYGEKGYVVNHSILQTPDFDFIYTCGPKPMMMAVANYAHKHKIPCEVSLENTMACGIGACLCCVEDTQDGHICVCTEGPVFNIEKLKWID